MLRALLSAIGFVILTTLLFLVLWPLHWWGMRGRGAVSLLYSRTVCAMLGLRIRVIGQPVQGRPVLVVSNHVSWADIIAITATAPTIFVAKREVATWPLVGLVATARPTVFVDRQRRHQTAEANSDIADRLSEGEAIVLFAEGTSSDGNRVLPFRSALLGAVKDALAKAGVEQITVQPLAITYTRLSGLPMGRRHRPLAAWYGDLDLVPHLTDCIRRGPMDVTLSWGEPIELDGQTDRKALAQRLEQEVRTMAALVLRDRPAIPAHAG